MTQRLLYPLLALVLPLAACGFEPVHAPRAASSPGAISVNTVDGRAGHELRAALLSELSPGLPGAEQGGALTLDLNERIVYLGFRPDGAAFRAAIRLDADYVLDLDSDAVSGSANAEVFYSVPPNTPYGDVSAQNDATERAARQLARRLRDDMVLQLSDRR